MFMVAASFRVVWYGPTYIETGLLYLIPIAWGIGKIKIRNKV
jgi:hypothetical protein